MSHSASILFAGTMLPALACAQDIIHYKFDSRTATTVLNYAAASGLAPSEVPLRYPPSLAYSDGRFGPAALHASPYVGVSANSIATGWTRALQGDLTIAFFARNRLAVGSAAISGFLGRGSFWLSTGGIAGAGLTLSGWGGPDLVADFGVALSGLAGWNHFAVVIDSRAGVATWYMNGTPRITTNVAGGVNLSGSTYSLRVGEDQNNYCGSLYDIDDVRVSGRAASAAEVRGWATNGSADAVGYGDGSAGSELRAVDAPWLGNSNHAVDVQATPQALFALGVGGERTRIDLSAFLGEPAALLTQPLVFVPGVLDAAGNARVGLAVPAVPALAHRVVYTQAFVVPAQGRPAVTNGIAHALAAETK